MPASVKKEPAPDTRNDLAICPEKWRLPVKRTITWEEHVMFADTEAFLSVLQDR